MSESAAVSCVVVTYDAMPWLEQCLASVAGLPTIVVDNGSSDGTTAFVRQRFPDVTLIESENRGLAAGWNRGLAETDAELVLVLNADAWLLDGALDALVHAANRHPHAAVVGPRLQNPDGTLQRSVRGFPTPWRIATEYLFLRKLGPRTQLLNAFYGAGFAHDEECEVEWVMGACMLLRREALTEVGGFDERYFLFSEEVDWMRRAATHGWTVVFTPAAGCVHVGGASHGGQLFLENIKGHLRYLRENEGPRAAARGRRVILLALRLRGLLYRGERGRRYREAGRWLRSAPLDSLLDA